jgi:hypothetical protein
MLTRKSLVMRTFRLVQEEIYQRLWAIKPLQREEM